MEMLQALLMRAFKSKQAKQKQRQVALVKVGTAAAAVPHHNRMLYVWLAAACCAAAAPMWLSSLPATLCYCPGGCQLCATCVRRCGIVGTFQAVRPLDTKAPLTRKHCANPKNK